MIFNNKTSKYHHRDYRSRNYSGRWQKRFIDEFVDSMFKKGIDTAQKEFSDAKEEHLPKSLYKFYDPSIYSLVNIQKQIIYLSSPRSFNDPFDSYICIDDKPYTKMFLLKAFRENNMISTEPSNDSFTEDEYRILKDSPIEGQYNKEYGYTDDFETHLLYISFNKSFEFRMIVNSLKVKSMTDCKRKVNFIRNIPFRVTCFSNFNNEEEICYNTTMWSHYANNHTGFCVKYSVNFDNIQNSDIIKCGLFPVIYTSRVPRLTLKELRNLKFSEDNLVFAPSALKKTYKTLITKSKFWNYEKEWRLIISKENELLLSDNTIPFLKIDSIYLGCRVEPNVMKFLVQHAEANGISIGVAEQSDECYKLHFNGLSSKGIKESEYWSKLIKCNRIEDTAIKNRHLNLLDTMFKE